MIDVEESRRTIWAARPLITVPHETTRDNAAVSVALILAETLLDEVERLRRVEVVARNMADSIIALREVRRCDPEPETKREARRIARECERELLDAVGVRDPGFFRKGGRPCQELITSA
jgi:hypothetical protein